MLGVQGFRVERIGDLGVLGVRVCCGWKSRFLQEWPLFIFWEIVKVTLIWRTTQSASA